MSFVDDIIFDLESEFSEEPSIKNWVMTSDGETVRINVDLWRKSPVLREHSANGLPQKTLSVPKCAVMALIEAQKGGTFPTEIQASYELLAAASELELKDLTSKCFDNIRKINAIDESVDFPPQLSTETVMLILRAFLDSPLRTVDVYRQQLSRIARYCANNRDVMINAVNVLKQSLAKFKCINLEGLPIGFETQTVPVAIYKRMGNLQTGVILGNELKPVNLFGDRIDSKELTNVTHFYLKYGVYVLYRRGSDVYRKNLQDDSEPTRILSRCWGFVSRGNFLFVTRGEGDCDYVSLWVDDERFEDIHQCSEYRYSESRKRVIPSIDFDDGTRVLAVLYPDIKLFLFRLEDESLSLLREEKSKDMCDVILSGRYMFLLPYSQNRKDIQTRLVPVLSNEEKSQSITEHPDDGSFIGISKPLWASAVYFGGRYFLTDNGRLELVMNFPSSDKVRTLMTDRELCALSELRMF